MIKSVFLCQSDLPYEGKKRCCEVDCSVIVYWLVHPDQFLEGQAVRTLASKAERRINVLQHVIHLRVVNTPSETRIKISRCQSSDKYLLAQKF